MPRVNSKKKGTAGKDYQCGRCGRKIEPGETYYSWDFRYGGTQRRCKDHYPRQSELTQSKMAGVYTALEDFEDSVRALEAPAEGDEDARNDLAQQVQDLANTAAEGVREVAEEYHEAAEAMGEAGSEHEEKADSLDGTADELEQYEGDSPEDYVDEDTGEFDFDGWRDSVAENIPQSEY